jgi:hypothetical protein
MSKLTVEINQSNIQKALESMGIKNVVVAEKPNPFMTAVAETNQEIIKSIDTDLGKEVNSAQMSQANDIIKAFEGMTQLVSKLSKSLEENNELVKGLKDEIGSIKQENVTLSTKLQEVVDSPLPKKSTIGFFEKGLGGEGMGGNKEGAKKEVRLSLAKNKKQIIQALEYKAEVNKIEFNQHNPYFFKALITYEGSNVLPKDIIMELQKDGIIITD